MEGSTDSQKKQKEDQQVQNNELKQKIDELSRCQQVFRQRWSKINWSSIRESPKKEQYFKQFVKNKTITSFRSYNNNFREYGINFIPECLQPISAQLQQGFCSKNYRIVEYIVRMALFVVRVKIFNIIQEDGYELNFSNQISYGVYGIVYEANNPFVNNQTVAIKQIKYNKYSHIAIEDAVKQYAMIKLLAALQVGPPSVRIFGFDLVVTPTHIFFSMQKGESINSWAMNNLQKEKVVKQFQKLEDSLLLLHSINICHNDIKPANIVFSPKLNKLVFIDFGFSEVKFEPIGYMCMCTAKGSLYYCSDQMKNLFLTTGQGFVDTYYNDYICLKKTKEYLMKNFLYSEKDSYNQSYFNENLYFPQYEQKILKFQEEVYCSLAIIYLAFLIEEKDSSAFTKFTKEQCWMFPFIEENIKIICYLFLQVQPSLSLWHLFLKFCDIYAPQSNFVNTEINKLIQKTIKPYFKAFFQKNVSWKSEQFNKFQDLNLQKQILKRYNKADISGSFFNEQNLIKQDPGEKILDLSEDRFQSLIPYFEKFQHLNYYKQKELTQLLITILNSKNQWLLLSDSEIKLLRKCFLIIDIKIKFSKPQHQSPYGIFKAFLNFFAHYLHYVHSCFDLNKVFSFAIKQFYISKIQNIQILKDFIMRDIDCEKELNRFEILQMYMLITEKMIDQFKNNMPYGSFIIYVKHYSLILERKIINCLDLMVKLIQNGGYQLLAPFMEALLKKYLNLRNNISLKSYVEAYHKEDFQNIHYFHMNLLRMAQHKNNRKYPNFVQNIDRDHFGLNFIRQLINVLTFSLLVPPTLTKKYQLVDRFKIIIQKAQLYLDHSESQYIRAILSSIQFKLFSLYYIQNNMLHALKLGKKILESKYFNNQQQSIFIVQAILRQMNDFKRQKIMKKKLQNFSFQSLYKCDGYINTENGLIHIQNQHETSKSKTGISLETIFSKLKEIWQKCLHQSRYENSFTQKLYLMRKILEKLILFNFSLKSFIQQYEKEIQKYKGFLETKFNMTNDIDIYHYCLQNSQNNQISVKMNAGQTLNQFMMYEKQLLIKHMLCLHNKIKDKDLIDQYWKKYTNFYQSIKTEISKYAQQSHRQLTCNYNQHQLNCAYFNLDQYSLQKSNNPHQAQCSQYNVFVQNLENSKTKLKQSIEIYLQKLDKSLLDHDFFINIMLALRQKTIQISKFPIERVNSQIKSYFYFMLQNNQTYHFISEKSIGRILLRQILSMSIEQIMASYLDDVEFKKVDVLQGNQRIIRQSLNFKESQRFKRDQTKRGRSQDFFQDIYMSLWRFIKQNEYVSHSNFIVDVSLDIRNLLLKSITSYQNSSKKLLNKMTKLILERLRMRIKLLAKQENIKSLLIMDIVMSTLKIDLGLQIQMQELYQLTSYMRHFKLQCQQLGRQAIYSLNLYYRLSPYAFYSSQQAIHIQSEKRYIYELNKISLQKCSLIKLFRNFKNKKLVTNHEKYIGNIVNILKQKIFTQIPKKQVENAIHSKLQNYIRCNLDDQSIFMK